MKKIFIDEDEMYPVYFITDYNEHWDGDTTLEVSDDLYERAKQAYTIFKDMQKELQTLYEDKLDT
jgi:hypothetical protein